MEKTEEYRLTHMAEPLLAWYALCARDLPWRREVTPYRTWVAEIMLQQTQVEAVKPYYERFLRALPKVSALAAVEEGVLLKLWEGLGYYRRVRNLQKAARIVVEERGGEFPDTLDGWRQLPGVGEYTAGAVASIAYGLPVPAVDGNALRVLARFLGRGDDIAQAKVKKEYTQLLSLAVSREQPGQFNQGIMDLGSGLCRKSSPQCPSCPLKELCLAHASGREKELPYKAPRKERALVQRTVLLIRSGGKALLHQRPPEGMLSGLWELPNLEGWQEPEQVAGYLAEKLRLTAGSMHRLPEAKHLFTHQEWRMQGYQIEVGTLPSPDEPGYAWAGVQEVKEVYSVPRTFAPYVRLWEEENAPGDKN
jgi:A/G-specific adenine glycosylase